MPKIIVDEGLCQGHGMCGQVAPDYFHHDDDGHVVVVNDEFDDADLDLVDQAVLSCPVYALEIEGE